MGKAETGDQGWPRTLRPPHRKASCTCQTLTACPETRLGHPHRRRTRSPRRMSSSNVPDRMKGLALHRTEGDDWKPGPKTWHPIKVEELAVPTPKDGSSLSTSSVSRHQAHGRCNSHAQTKSS